MLQDLFIKLEPVVVTSEIKEKKIQLQYQENSDNMSQSRPVSLTWFLQYRVYIKINTVDL